MFSIINNQRTPIEIELIGERRTIPKTIPMIPNPRIDRKTFKRVLAISRRPSPLNQSSVLTFLPPARAYETPIEITALTSVITIAKVFMEANLPTNILIRPGWRTKRFRRVPSEYSWAVWAAKTQRAMIPRRPPILEKDCVAPLGKASISRVICTPRSPFP